MALSENPRPILGIVIKLIAIGLFVSMSAIVKHVGDAVPVGEVIFFRSIFAMPIVMGWLALQGRLKGGLHTRHPLMHGLRGIVGVSAMALNFISLIMLPLPEITAIGFAAPLFTTVLAIGLLGERVGPFRLSMVAMGLIGVIIVIWPRLTFLDSTFEQVAALGALAALGSAALRAFVQIHVRRMVETEETAAIVFYFLLTACILSLLTAPFGWVMPDLTTGLLLVVAGLMGGVGQIMITSAYRHGTASLLAPFDYVSMLYALLLGWFLFAELPTLGMLVGSVIVIASGILIIWREHQLGVKRGKARQKMTPQG